MHTVRRWLNLAAGSLLFALVVLGLLLAPEFFPDEPVTPAHRVAISARP